jgi:hypothetical protein
MELWREYAYQFLQHGLQTLRQSEKSPTPEKEIMISIILVDLAMDLILKCKFESIGQSILRENRKETFGVPEALTRLRNHGSIFSNQEYDNICLLHQARDGIVHSPQSPSSSCKYLVRDVIPLFERLYQEIFDINIDERMPEDKKYINSLYKNSEV